MDNKTNTSNYTFLNEDILNYNSSTTYLKGETNIEEQNVLEKKEEKYKKKKVIDTTIKKLEESFNILEKIME